ncbi:hypothetical protein F5Y06DRAFT_303820 [Hypoxylon sp. FL0890]|nr:hypothetical protein F5Y06DRAFT_303820 [Hypoxylon sp. FL0890]
MASGSTTDAVYNGEKSLNSNTKPNTDDNRKFEAVRLAAFMTTPPSAIVASDLKPQDIHAAHRLRIVAELKNIVPSLPRV